MPRYKITFTSISGLADDREGEFAYDGDAIAYATMHAKGRRAHVHGETGRQIHDNRKVTGEDGPG